MKKENVDTVVYEFEVALSLTGRSGTAFHPVRLESYIHDKLAGVVKIGSEKYNILVLVKPRPASIEQRLCELEMQLEHLANLVRAG